ncbi:class I SAM-dependent methyltransferase [Rhodohalobacter sp. 8-1]|uniref:class I SAM-dependent methyltransferase n=1 Tax=Rhodohalobacter sp. 8-1 TaxID=3131972 RepID=UPI0030EBAF79
MSKIEYDPVKDKFSAIIKNSRVLRRIFYFLLDLFFLRSWHIRRMIKRAGEALDQKGEWKLLDAGCGFGQYDRFILSCFDNVTVDSVDVKKDYLRDNEHYFEDEIKRGEVQFYYADLLQFDADKTFDMAICIDVLEHIEEDVRVMENISKHLKHGGYFLMHSPSHYSEEDGDEDDSFVGEHARPGYSKEEISDKLKQAGLEPKRVHYTYGFWGHKAWVLSVKWPMIWFNKLGLFAAIPLLIYYPVVMPFCLLMNLADLYTKNEKGNGIYALARKA